MPFVGLLIQLEKKNNLILKSVLCADESTCCDEDFQWVGNKNEVDVKYLPTKPNDAPMPQDVAGSSSSGPRNMIVNHKTSQKPPRPASLDRRRLVHHHTRYERDSKSRSAHSLQEAQPTPDTKCPSRGKHWMCSSAHIGLFIITHA